MAELWSLEDARHESKRVLQRRAAAIPGLFEALPQEWNARDGEYVRGASRLVHFTNLHTQPWRPFPERFVYQRHPQQALWLELERAADDAGFDVFTRERPSESYRRHAGAPALDQTPQEDLPWVLGAELDGAARPVRFHVNCDPPRGLPRGPDGRHEPARTADWWSQRLDEAAARKPGVAWEAQLHTASGRVHRRGGPMPDGSPPRVWVLLDDRAGNTTQSIGLADTLGWPYEIRQLVTSRLSALHNRFLGASTAGIDEAKSDALAPPWPDLVIAAGRRTAPVALWIRRASGGATRLVQLGRKGGDHADLFDLVVTPAYTHMFPHPRRVELCAPLHRVMAATPEEAGEEFSTRLGGLPSPRIALLVGGKSGQHYLPPQTARHLGESVARQIRESGGSVLTATSRRTGARATAELRRALAGVPGVFHAQGDAPPNPYLGFLAWADALVATGDSESMLAEAISVGKPVSIYPLPVRPSFRVLRAPRDLVLHRALAQPKGARGTGRPQRGLELFCARLIERGFVRPTRDVELLHADLIRRGLAQRFGGPPTALVGEPLGDARAVADRVRELLGRPLQPPL
jgi:mitochondrial fission protein ELM1